MSATTMTSKDSLDARATVPTVTAEDVLQGLHRLPHATWPEVLQFIEFLEYKQSTEDEALWQTVQAEKAYRQANPDDVILCRSTEELAAALGDDK